MPRKLAICHKEQWFLREPKRLDDTLGYPIYYRYVISCAIAYNILKHKKELAWFTEEMEVLMSSVNNRLVYECEDFLELYPLADSSGFVLVDKTNSCYPLIIYGARFEQDSKSRIYAFQKSLEDLHYNLDVIYNKLSNLDTGNPWTKESEDNWLDNWTEKFQEELREIFDH